MKRLAPMLSKIALILAGVLSAGFGIKGFLLSSRLIDGGITGVSMLVALACHVQLEIVLPIINLPFIFIGFTQLGWAFAVRSAVGIAGIALAIAFLPFPAVTSDRLLTAIFGGIFLGGGIGLAVRGGAVLDGTEIMALLISRKRSSVSVGDVILVFNIILFIVALVVLGIDATLYSILTYVSAAKTVDFVIHGIDEFTAITIVSDMNALIRERITGELGRGVTVYKGYGGKTGAEKDILYCVVTRLEIDKIKSIVRELDPKAFIVFHPLGGVEGGVVRKRHLKNI